MVKVIMTQERSLNKGVFVIYTKSEKGLSPCYLFQLVAIFGF
jgi:hypothetical protein